MVIYLMDCYEVRKALPCGIKVVCVLQTIESGTCQYKTEIDHLQSLLDTAKDKLARDKEGLKKATRSVGCCDPSLCTRLV